MSFKLKFSCTCLCFGMCVFCGMLKNHIKLALLLPSLTKSSDFMTTTKSWALQEHSFCFLDCVESLFYSVLRASPSGSTQRHPLSCHCLCIWGFIVHLYTPLIGTSITCRKFKIVMYLLCSYNPDVMFVLYFDLLDALVSCQTFKKLYSAYYCF